MRVSAITGLLGVAAVASPLDGIDVRRLFKRDCDGFSCLEDASDAGIACAGAAIEKGLDLLEDLDCGLEIYQFVKSFPGSACDVCVNEIQNVLKKLESEKAHTEPVTATGIYYYETQYADEAVVFTLYQGGDSQPPAPTPAPGPSPVRPQPTPPYYPPDGYGPGGYGPGGYGGYGGYRSGYGGLSDIP